MTISLEDAQKAWAYSPKGKFSSREKADLNGGVWTTEKDVPILKGQRFKAVPRRNEKQNISFTIEKL